MSTTNKNVTIKIQVKPGKIQSNVDEGVQLKNVTTGEVISPFGSSPENAVTDIISGGTIQFYAVNYNRNNPVYQNYKIYMVGLERKAGAQDLVGLPEKIDQSLGGDSPNYLECDVLTGVEDNSIESYTITIEMKNGDDIIGVYDIDPKMRMRSRGSSQ